MKNQITIQYMHGLGDFLDSKKIDWMGADDRQENIIINLTNLSKKEIFLLGIELGEFRKSIK